MQCKHTTLASFVAALKDWSTTHGCGELPRGELYARLQKGLTNTFGLVDHSVSKQAFTMQDLANIHQHINVLSFEGARDWCMLTLAFFGLLRIGEYCDGGLRMQDITLYRWGIKLVIPFSKTATYPVEIRIAARGDDDLLCPARALRNYIQYLHPLLTSSLSTPLFLKEPFALVPVTASAFTLRIHAFATLLRKDPSSYAGHSLRRGGATALYIAGVPEAVIQQHGRWKSLTVRRYLESSSYHQLMPSILLLSKTTGLFPRAV